MDYKTAISIDGKYLSNFEQVTLTQTINNHHEFKVIVDHDEIEISGSHTLETSKKWLGRSIVISFDETEFVGIITHVKMQHNDGHQGDIEVSGYSKTILLEQGKHTVSWLEKSLDNIIKDVVETANVETQIKAKNKSLLSYEAQYGESNYQFVQRLAKQHNEWLYYDGIKLIFGKPQLGDPVSLQYGKELSNISIGIQARASRNNTFSYNSLHDTINESKTKNDVEGLNELGMEAFDTSLEIFKTVPNSHSVARTSDKSQLQTSVKNKQAATVADLNILEADCNQQNLTVGSVIKVSSAKWDGKNSFDIQNYGEYIVIEIEHNATGNTTYSSHFKAIPSGVAISPEPIVALPQANSQIATVISNADPKGKGRVQVQFLWQKHQQKTNWIRVMTPDAGQSEHHSQNRGHLFIPEEGDQVMVGFRYADPNRPYVMGSLFSGTTGAGGKEDNTHKSIITRSGHVIEFNDTDRQESITIKDKSGNQIFYDTKNKNITITAPETLTLNCKNMNINVAENLNTNVGANSTSIIGVNATENIGMNKMSSIAGNNNILVVGEMKEIIEGDLISETKKERKEISNGKFDVQTEGEFTSNSEKKIKLNSTENSSLF